MPTLIAPRQKARVAAVAVGLFTLQFAACSTATGYKEPSGAFVGAGLGAYAGSRIGSGSGSAAATAIGALLGALFGAEVGRSLDRADAAYAAMSAQAPYGPVPPSPPPPPPMYSASQPYTRPLSSYALPGNCRTFQQRVFIEMREEVVYGTACQQPDGSWRLIP